MYGGVEDLENFRIQRSWWPGIESRGRRSYGKSRIIAGCRATDIHDDDYARMLET
jgi:hypothetical protein